MSKGEVLRALVAERLSAAAEEIFALFEITIAQYEHELCLYKEQNQSLRGSRPAAGIQTLSLSPGLSLNLESTESPQIKEEPEEQSVKQEEEQPPECVRESSAVYLKSEESSLLQQRQTEHQTQGEDIGSELHEGHFADTENDDREPPFSCSVSQAETESNGAHNSRAKTKFRSTAAQTFERAKPREVTCPFCRKRFNSKLELQMHIRVHSGEKRYICYICEKRFADKSNLRSHIRTHSDVKPYSCSICEKAFTRNGTLRIHMRVHTGEKPYSCSACTKTFTRKDHLRSHKKTHKDGDFSFEETLQLFNL